MSFLAKIIAHKRVEIAALDARALRGAAEQSPKPRDFVAALQRRRLPGRPGLIAELKRASPSKGMLAAHLDLAQVAEIYASNGAAAISVLTDEAFFMGSLATLRHLRTLPAVDLPLLRKDFILRETQLYETRANGADAVLLIAAALADDGLLADLHALALDLGLTPLVEIHNVAETDRVLRLKDVRLVGINNRNLDTFEVTLGTSEQLRPLIPAGITVVSESGISNPDDVERLARTGVDAILVGEALITARDIATGVRALSGMTASMEQRPV